MDKLCDHGCGKVSTYTTKGSLWSGPFKGKPIHQCSKSANSCPAVKQRKIKASMDKYGTEYPWQTADVLKKRAESNIKKYGHTCSLLNTVQQAKRKATMTKRHGVEEPILNPTIKAKASANIKQAYLNDPTLKTRIIKTRRTRYGINSEEVVAKHRKTRIEKGDWVDPSDTRLWRNYKKSVKYHTTQTYKRFKHLLNPNSLELGRNTYHLDHMLSRKDGFDQKIDPIIISHPANLRVIEAKENRKKYVTSCYSLEELLQKITAWNE